MCLYTSNSNRSSASQSNSNSSCNHKSKTSSADLFSRIIYLLRLIAASVRNASTTSVDFSSISRCSCACFRCLLRWCASVLTADTADVSPSLSIVCSCVGSVVCFVGWVVKRRISMPTPPTNSQQPLPLRLRLRSVNSLAVRSAHSVFVQQAVPLILQTHLVATV